MEDGFFVYILASRRNGTLYVGVTNDLARRIAEHKSKLVPGFTENTASARWSMSMHFLRFLRPLLRTRVEAMEA